MADLNKQQNITHKKELDFYQISDKNNFTSKDFTQSPTKSSAQNRLKTILNICHL